MMVERWILGQKIKKFSGETHTLQGDNTEAWLYLQGQFKRQANEHKSNDGEISMTELPKFDT